MCLILKQFYNIFYNDRITESYLYNCFCQRKLETDRNDRSLHCEVTALGRGMMGHSLRRSGSRGKSQRNPQFSSAK